MKKSKGGGNKTHWFRGFEGRKKKMTAGLRNNEVFELGLHPRLWKGRVVAFLLSENHRQLGQGNGGNQLKCRNCSRKTRGG